jgi:CRP-like cAMP-binding protein
MQPARKPGRTVPRAKLKLVDASTTGVVIPKLKELLAFNAQTFLDTVGVGRVIGKYKKDDTIFLQGDPADAVFYIQKGKVQIMVVSKQGKEGVVAVLGAGEFFGEGCLAGQPFHISTASATVDATIVKIEKQTMIRVLRDEPALSQMFMSFLLARNVQVEADLIDQLFNSSEKRLARILLLLANIGKEGKMESVPAINQEILAARVGTTRSRINFFMNKFRKLGFIDYNSSGTMQVHTSLLNVIVHD